MIVLTQKKITFLPLLLLSVFIFLMLGETCVQAQEETDSVQTEIKTEKKKERKGMFKGLFKKKEKKKKKKEQEAREEDINFENNPEEPDSLSEEEKQPKRKGLFSRKRKSESNKGVSRGRGNEDSSTGEPVAIDRKTWNNYTRHEQDSILRVWDQHDKKNYRKKYTYNEQQRKILQKTKPNILDKIRYRLFIRNKPMRYKRKLMKRKNKRYLKAGRIEKKAQVKNDSLPSDSTFNRQRYRQINYRERSRARRETVRKNKVALKYDKKEERLVRKYKLSDEESVAFYKGRATPLKGREKILFKRATRKKEAFAYQMTKLRRERSYALQNKKTRKQMRKDKRRIKRRDKKMQKRKKKRRKGNEKYNSYEYPEKYKKREKKQ
ncbi:MAG: hypothetical protein CSB06_01245 [Bacteroidia bacterium]|nr:MAG: hypothetical protein CSB06_01245 [Bacteroidia bacterium]